MEWKRALLALFLIPTLLYGYEEVESRFLYAKVGHGWIHHHYLTEQFQKHFKKHGFDAEGIHLLKEALKCCQDALNQCEILLADIAKKSKVRQRREAWIVELKKNAEEDKSKLLEEMRHLQIDIQRMQANVSANSLFFTALDKAELAYEKDRSCQRNHQMPLSEVASTLSAVSALYQEASALLHRAYLLLLPYPQKENQDDLKRASENYRLLAEKFKIEASEWPQTAAIQKAAHEEKIARLKIDAELLEERGLKRAALELKKQAASLLGQELEIPIEEPIAPPLLDAEAFHAREQERKSAFFQHLGALPVAHFGTALPLDGQTLFTEQFYRVLIQSDHPATQLFVNVYEEEKLIHQEAIALPLIHSPNWDEYLTRGMLLAPNTPLEEQFGLSLRLRLVCDPHHPFALLVAHQATEERYQFSFALDPDTPLYTCRFATPPPWQLEALKKPSLPQPNPLSDPLPAPPLTVDPYAVDLAVSPFDMIPFPVLDRLVEELKKDPLALASYVQNEIAFADPYVHQEQGIFYPPSIHRYPEVTLLGKQGSPWEQCQLLVMLLRRAGYPALFAWGDPCTLPKKVAETLLLTKLPDDQSEARLKYPWVVFFDGTSWISLFPWMKEVQVLEGRDLYGMLPTEYGSADRWVLHYLRGSEEILKHIGSDGDDTAAALFVRCAEEQLKKKGLSLSDVGIQRTAVKKQYSSWNAFPRPTSLPEHKLYYAPDTIYGAYAYAKLDFCSRQNPTKFRSCTLPLALLSHGISAFRFMPEGNKQFLALEVGGRHLEFLELDDTDQVLDIALNWEVFLGNRFFTQKHTFSIDKGTTGALCAHFGGETPQITALAYEKFAAEKNESVRLIKLLALVGASYFEKCGRAEKMLADLHKINPTSPFSFGLIKLAPDLSKGPYRSDLDLILPQVDTFSFDVGFPTLSTPAVWHQEYYSARSQFEILKTVDASSQEHQILRDIFQDPHALSTVKLLQLAQLAQLRSGEEGDGFLTFTAGNVDPKHPALEQSPWQANLVLSLMDPTNPWSRWSILYMTPGLVESPDGSRKEQGALLLSPFSGEALITNNHLILNGGLGSPLPPDFLTPTAVREWQLVPDTTYHTYSLQLSQTPAVAPVPEAPIVYKADVRSWLKSILQSVADPVDTLTGAFYIDETDLTLPGPFPLALRRNYNSQNLLPTEMGWGWKLSLNPHLVEQGGKRFAAELDGSWIVYSYNRETSRWEVLPEENPELHNDSQKGIGGTANPFHAYIENEVLYGSDGSKRYFKEGLLDRWLDASGNTLFFFYNKGQLAKIESSHGAFLGFHINGDGKISEIYAQDGRRIGYEYNVKGDLIKVTLPNGAVVAYDYDSAHRMIREKKPHGRVLENSYDEKGRVVQQRSPMGQQQEMVATAAFEYGEGITTVTDAAGGKTVYKFSQNMIYQVIDPQGVSTFQTWFIDGVRSLKSTTDKRGLTVNYRYDSRGNPVEIRYSGADLTGNRETAVVKTVRYNERNLPIEEEVEGQKTVTTYDAAFPYLPHSVETSSSYVRWEYNGNGQVEKEDRNGAVTLWKYDARGFPMHKVQLSGTDDPDVVTTYAYNLQGQCIEIVSSDGTVKNGYDLMGNQIASRHLSPSGALLSEMSIGYDLNGAPLWKQAAHRDNVVYFDYAPSGLLKATRQAVAYTLYAYDVRGYLVEETDPLGFTTYREYDPLGKVISETKEGHATTFSYEPGGLLATATSPSGALRRYEYTTNGLLKKEVHPDGTADTTVYDLFGRPIQERKNGIVWEIAYDDASHRVVRTHAATGETEVSLFDARGNLIAFTDRAGYTATKSYDGLNRLKSETSPSGKKTLWSYVGNAVICQRPNGETATTYYAGGVAVQSEVRDARGILVASAQFHVHPERGEEVVVEGDERTVIAKNALGLPVKIEKGNSVTLHTYDACGRCIATTDADGKTTRQTFDGLGRLVQKQLPDGSAVEYAYDLDSNLIACRMPNGNVWKAAYDAMRRKYCEEERPGCPWRFTYADGYLKEAVDPLNRTHCYAYDTDGRLIQDAVEGWKRTYTYDPRGMVATAEQTLDDTHARFRSWLYGSNGEHSAVHRSYDPDGNLASESIYLNGALLQKTEQAWTESGRRLTIGPHQREMSYQNQRLVAVSTPSIEVSYGYTLSGALQSKSHRFCTTAIETNALGLPEKIVTQLPTKSFPEQLHWNPSGKLARYAAPEREERFTYDPLGHYESAVEFTLAGEYDRMGQLTSQEGKTCAWDPWGHLLQVKEPSYTWRASYDALGRRLQTCYTPWWGEQHTATSLYDPEIEFREIGLQCGDTLFWKLYGPNGCDIVVDGEGRAVSLVHNGLGQLAAVVSDQETVEMKELPSAYGPQGKTPPIPKDLMGYGLALNWHSLAQDPTGLIWMGARYYDPNAGRFLSPDPVSYPACLDLYVYANGDPINYSDPNGRFASYVYKTLEPVLPIVGGYKNTIKTYNNLSTSLANANLVGSQRYEVGSYDLPNGAILYVNGTNTSKERAVQVANQLSQYANGAKIYGIYNSSNTLVVDILECATGRIGIYSPTVQLIKNQMHDLMSIYPQETKFLIVNHSGGANQVKNFLQSSPQSVRERIYTLGIAPSDIIPRHLCLGSRNYMSKNDFVTLLDIFGSLKYADQLNIVDPHPKASTWDHECLTPTFEELLKQYINEYINAQ